MGRLVADPEYRTTNTGVAVTRFRIAIDRDYTKEGEEKKADFIPCTAWRSSADFVNKYFRKGNMIAVIGQLRTEPYEDKNGNKRTDYSISVDKVSFCGSKSETNPDAGSENRTPAEQHEEAPVDDDLPF